MEGLGEDSQDSSQTMRTTVRRPNKVKMLVNSRATLAATAAPEAAEVQSAIYA